MKKLLTLILCWLLAFSAIAETTFKAKTAASVAGGYVTSLNKVDGSFEDGTTGWSASVGTIVKTASTEMQGNNIGVWSGTGTGTLNLQWTATALNTYEASAQVDVQGEDDVYVCAYVGTTETGCKLIPALSKIQKVSVVADSVMSSAFYLRLKHTGSDAFNVKTDDGKIEPWTPQAVNLEVKEAITYTGYTSKDGSNYVKFKTKDTIGSYYGSIIKVDDTTYPNHTRFIVLKAGYVNLSASFTFSSVAGNVNIQHFNSSGTSLKSASMQTTSNSNASTSITTFANVGDYFLAYSANAPSDNNTTNFSITASAISENVVQSWQDVTEPSLYPTVTTSGFGTVDFSGLKAWRDKAELVIKGTITLGAVTGDANYIKLPWGLRTQSQVKITKVGDATRGTAGAASFPVLIPSGSVDYFVFSIQSTSLGGYNASYGGSSVFGNSENVSFEARIPIQGWSSNPTLYAFPTRSEVFSANVAEAGTVTNATQGFVTSCTNAAPSVCSLWSNFGVTPICWAHTTDITKRAEVSSSTATTTTVARTDTSTAFNLFCHLK